ncbi:hypothetical protein GLOIN_2v1764523 [Rhizophagus clarus]|uniref:Uncharacterized protein n=1 Tax=Rhizophagus clarus TaxID=94130 RepID=A0A8H3L196_9GLOM|nr:hypothetical protein GLOIN_2v1764523 [Rhizophagus clarus]
MSDVVKDFNTGKIFLIFPTSKFYNGEDITSIKQFTPVFEEISDDDKAFEHCMEDIILKLSNEETMADANEATLLRKDISGEYSTGRVDYAIKALEDLLCITEGKTRNIKI